MPRFAELTATLRSLRSLRLSRGRGALARDALLRRLQSDEASIDEETRVQLAELLSSMSLAIEDAEREARQNLKVTSRTISHAIRRGGR